MPGELEKFPDGAFGVRVDIEEFIENTVDNMKLVEEKLSDENVFLVMGEGGVCTFYKGELRIKFFDQSEEEAEVTIPKGNIIEILMSDEEEIEVSDGEETQSAQSKSDPACQVPVPVTVNHVETASTVWVTRIA